MSDRNLTSLSTKRIDVAFGFDADYAPHAAATLASLCAHHDQSRLRIILLSSEVTPQLRRQFQGVAPRAEFIWIEVRDEDFPQFERRGHLNRSTLFRLGLEQLAPADVTRVVYLDADLIVLRDVQELWQFDLNGAPVAAVIDALIDADEFSRKWGLADGNEYFNAGLLVIDLERVRKQKLFSAALQFLAQNIEDLPFLDQDALNWACWGHWVRLPISWNVQQYMAMPQLTMFVPETRRLGQSSPSVVHFTGPDKPWLSSSWHPWQWLYWKHLAKTSFESEISLRFGMTRKQKIRIWLRWLRRRPKRNHAGT